MKGFEKDGYKFGWVPFHSLTIQPFNESTGKWLPNMDLNHDKQIQSLLCYHYTIRQARCGQEGSHFKDRVKPESRAGMTKECPMTKREMIAPAVLADVQGAISSFGFRASFVIGASSFVI